MTFSGGPRGCPGKHIGIEMCRVALAKVVERFELLPSDRGRTTDGGSIPKFVEWEIDGIPLEINPRVPAGAGRALQPAVASL